MAYDVVLYRNDSDMKKVNKVLHSFETTECEIRSTEDIINPVIMLKIPNGNSVNYVRIDSAPYNGRYYFVTSYTASANGIVVLNLHEDVLMSLIGERKAATGKGIVKQHISGSPYVDNGTFASETRKEIEQVNFANGFNELGEYILITAGGY